MSFNISWAHVIAVCPRPYWIAETSVGVDAGWRQWFGLNLLGPDARAWQMVKPTFVADKKSEATTLGIGIEQNTRYRVDFGPD